MNSIETFLTILFVIVVYLVVVNKIPTQLIIGAVALWFTILWIGFDNMDLWKSSNIMNNIFNHLNTSKYRSIYKKNTMHQTKNTQRVVNPQRVINKQSVIHPQKLMKSQNKSVDKIDIEKKVNKANQEAKKEISNTEPTHLKYSEDNYKYNIFDDIGSSGDNMLAHKQKHRSNMNRVAMDNFSRSQTKFSNINYFAQELKDAEASRWWDNEKYEGEF